MTDLRIAISSDDNVKMALIEKARNGLNVIPDSFAQVLGKTEYQRENDMLSTFHGITFCNLKELPLTS